MELETSDLYPGVSLYKPQLVYKNYFDNIGDLSYNNDWYGTEKIDGYWETFIKENDEIYMFARGKSKTTGFYTEKSGHVPHLVEWMKECVPNGTTLIGEVYLPGKTSKDITTILGCKEAKAIERQEVGQKLHYYIHDILRYDGEDFVKDGLSNDARVNILYDKIDLGTDLIPEIKVAEYLDGYYVDFDAALNRIFNNGGEGIVFRKKDGLYLPGKRNRTMFKVKEDAGDMDFVVTGFVDPEREYTGKEIETWPYWEETLRLGKLHKLDPGVRIKTPCTPVTKAYFNGWKMGVTLGLYDGDHLVDCGKCTSGFTDVDRADMAKNPSKYLWNTVTVGAMSVDKKEYSLRHPRFIAWHFDKPSEDCKLEDVFK